VLRATGAFTDEEVAVALELMDLGLQPGGHGYAFLVAEEDRRAVGYVCWGRAPFTDGTYDLYWIAVDPARHGGGIGRRLMDAAERAAKADGGRLMLVETAGKPQYAATRAFYERLGYVEAARVPDFYRRGDDKIVYLKRLTPVERT
jgi:ribosomal protein S18 acetylase RimI-like enzyme